MSVIDYHGDLRVLVSVKGHPYPRDAFAALLESMPGIACTQVEQPASQRLLSPQGAAAYHAALIYDMPGIDFSARPPRLVEPPAALRHDLIALLEQGFGMVFLHHAIAGWPLWPEYGEIVGGRFLYRPAEVRGRECLDSGYRHAVSHRITRMAEHPVLEGVEPDFGIEDELYLYQVFDDSIVPLLRSDYRFDREHFFSAFHAVSGRMHCREGWDHPPGSSLVGWVKHYRNSPIVYLQPGDDVAAYENPAFRRLLDNALRWVAGEEAHRWARERNRAELPG